MAITCEGYVSDEITSSPPQHSLLHIESRRAAAASTMALPIPQWPPVTTMTLPLDLDHQLGGLVSTQTTPAPFVVLLRAQVRVLMIAAGHTDPVDPA